MLVQKSKSFITILLAVALLGAWFAGQSEPARKSNLALAQTGDTTQPTAAANESATSSSNDAASVRGSTFEDGYRAGYRDGHQDCGSTNQVTRTRYTPRARYAPRVRVAGARYYAEGRRGHSTRNMILRIAAPAALGAGIGAIAGGGKGAGAGALIGGGAGALYHLVKHGRD
jgi:hypothetical protein